MLLHEHDGRVELVVLVALLPEAVALVEADEVPHRRPVALHGRDDLVRLGAGHPRIVRARDDEEGLSDGRGVGEGGDAGEERAHLRIPLVAVLGAAQILAVAARALEEADEIRDSDHVQGAADLVAVGDGGRERHVPAIAAPGDHDARRVEIGTRCDPVDRGADVLDGVLPAHPVVQKGEGLSEARRAPDVGVQDRHTELVDEIVVAAEIRRARLSLRPSVNADDDRPLALERPRGRIEKSRDRAPVETLPADELGRPQGVRVQAAELALGPALDLARIRVEGVRIARTAGIGEGKTEILSVGVPLEGARGPRAETRDDRLLLRIEVADTDHARTVLVRDERQALAVARQVEDVDAPGNLRRQGFPPPRREVEPHETQEFRAGVGRRRDRLAVRKESRLVVGDEALAAARRQRRLLPCRRIDQPEVGLIDRDSLDHENAPAVGRPVERLPAASRELGHETIAARVGRVLGVQVRVVPVAARRGVGDAVAGTGPDDRPVSGLAVGQEGDASGREVVAVLLEELSAPDVLREHEEVAAAGGGKYRADGALGKERELPPRPAGCADEMDLRRLSEAGGDQHLPALRVPARKRRRPRLRVGSDRRGHRRGNLRDSLHDEVLVGNDLSRLGARRRESENGCGQAERETSHRGISCRSPSSRRRMLSLRGVTPAGGPLRCRPSAARSRSPCGPDRRRRSRP